MLVSLCHCKNQNPQKVKANPKGGFVLAHSFRVSTQGHLAPLCSGLWRGREHTAEQSCSFMGGQGSREEEGEEEREGRRERMRVFK